MLFTIGLVVIVFGGAYLIMQCSDNPIISLGFSVILSLIACACFIDIVNNVKPTTTESKECYTIETMDEDKVAIDGKVYEYKLVYAEDAETPYVTIVDLEYPKWYKIMMVTKANKTIAYVYTNDIAAIENQ